MTCRDVPFSAQMLPGVVECGFVPFDQAADPVFLQGLVTRSVTRHAAWSETLTFGDEQVVVTGGVGRSRNMLRPPGGGRG